MGLLTLDLKINQSINDKSFCTSVCHTIQMATVPWIGKKCTHSSSAFYMGHHKWPALMLRDGSLTFLAMET